MPPPQESPPISNGSSTPSRRLWDSKLDNGAADDPGPSSFNAASPMASGIATIGGFVRTRPHRGMTMEEVHSAGVISDVELSHLFDDIPLEEKDIKRMPRKMRPYFENLSLLKDHYSEVDNLLSGELPSTIAQSFKPPKRPTSYTRMIGELEESYNETMDHTPPWIRRSSAWKVKKSDDTDENEALLPASEGRDEKRERIAKLALNINTIVNILLVAAKAIAVLYSASISLTASLVDSALDLLSTFIILGTSWAIGAKSDKHLYPAGKRRFEPLGVLIFSVAMIASFVQVFIESFQRALHPPEGDAVSLSWVGIGTMLATIAVKTVLWIWCSRIPSSGVQALAQDAENDVFFNIMSLAFPFIGTKLNMRLLDPIGGMVLSTYIIVEWVKTLLQNFANLSGKSASGDQITRVLYLVSRFNPVLEIGEVECYHIGDDLIVEIDVILPAGSTLHFAHDVGETIQCVLESLDGVLRAYVHCDYSSQNPSQHTSRIPNEQNQTDSRKGSQRSLTSDPPSRRTSGSVTPKFGDRSHRSDGSGAGVVATVLGDLKDSVVSKSPGTE